MSLRRRFLNIARAEIKSAFKGLTRLGTDPLSADERRVDEELREAERARQGAGSDRGHSTGRDPLPAEVGRYYANLELPLGAGADEVKAAYRRLMRRYHPDRHASDDDMSDVATDLAKRLTEARDALLAHLGE